MTCCDLNETLPWEISCPRRAPGLLRAYFLQGTLSPDQTVPLPGFKVTKLLDLRRREERQSRASFSTAGSGITQGALKSLQPGHDAKSALRTERQVPGEAHQPRG